MKKGCIYYTTNAHDPKILSVCQKQLGESFDGEIICVSSLPTAFGTKNIVLPHLNRGYYSMMVKILTALEASMADIVFFTEDDVLYHPSHFKINPERNDVYYYNVNNWRWRWETEVAVTYNYLTSLSGMCCDRDLAIRHYKHRMEVTKDFVDREREREPRWARRFGYEPGTKPRRRGGITDEEHIRWWSEFPNVDIRHKGTFSHPKTFLDEFKHKPTESWKEINIKDIPGWDIKKLFNL